MALIGLAPNYLKELVIPPIGHQDLFVPRVQVSF